MNNSKMRLLSSIGQDILAGLVVFLVALPLCLGVALASGTPLVSGLLAGVIGGIVVGFISGSHTSVAGPAAGLTAVVSAQMLTLGSFPAFLLAVVIAGIVQIFLGICRLGVIAEYMPSSVIKGMLAAIGIILILKQLPYLFGFAIPKNVHPDYLSITFIQEHIHYGASAIGLACIGLLEVWSHSRLAKKSMIPGPLVAVLIGISLGMIFSNWGDRWAFADASRLVEVPVVKHLADISQFINWPDLSQLTNMNVYIAGVTIAAVASLETLLNLEAVDRLDPLKRLSPPNRELVAQGVGNIVAGSLGGIPVTSVIVRSSVNIQAGATSKRSAILHGIFLCCCVLLIPTWLNYIPLSCLAAILIVTGFKLASPQLVIRKIRKGFTQFVPFVVTVIAIVLTDLLLGVIIGLGCATVLILRSNLTIPLGHRVEQYGDGEWLRITLPNQVSFLNRARLARTFCELPANGRLILDASNTHYIDPDVIELIREFRDPAHTAHQRQIVLIGFAGRYGFNDDTMPI